MASAQNSRVSNTTLEFIPSTVYDTINKSSWILRTCLSNPTPANGRQVTENITTTTSTQGGSFKGTETFTTSVEFAPITLNWYYTGYAQPVTVSMVEMGINQTPLGRVALKKASFEWAQNSMSNALGTILYGLGLGNDFDGLGLIVDDGTSAANYGGLSRTTYTSINAGGSTGIIAATSGVIDLATMDSADDAATISGLVSETPRAILTTRAAFSLYGQLFEPTKMATYGAIGGGIQSGDASGVGTPGGTSNLQTGSSQMSYRDKPMFRDDKCTSGVMFFLNNDPSLFKFYSLSIPGLSQVSTANTTTSGVYDKVPPTAFQWRDLMSPVNQLAQMGIFVVYGQLIHAQPNRNEKITGITTL